MLTVNEQKAEIKMSTANKTVIFYFYFYLLAAPFCSDHYRGWKVWHQMPFWTQPGLEPAASGLQNHCSDCHWVYSWTSTCHFSSIRGICCMFCGLGLRFSFYIQCHNIICIHCYLKKRNENETLVCGSRLTTDTFFCALDFKIWFLLRLFFCFTCQRFKTK